MKQREGERVICGGGDGEKVTRRNESKTKESVKKICKLREGFFSMFILNG